MIVIQLFASAEHIEKLQDTIQIIPNNDPILLIRDINIQISSERQIPEDTIEPYGSAVQTNNNSERLLLCNTNAFETFQTQINS